MKQISSIIRSNILLLLLIVFLLLIIVVVYSSRGYDFVEEYEGIEFDLDSDEFVNETLIFDGVLSDPLIGHTRFSGRIIYGENVYHCTLIFRNNFDHIQTINSKETSDYKPTKIYIKDDLEDIVLIISEKEGTGASWNNRDGLVFVSSTDNIDDAYITLEEIVTDIDIVK